MEKNILDELENKADQILAKSAEAAKAEEEEEKKAKEAKEAEEAQTKDENSEEVTPKGEETSEESAEEVKEEAVAKSEESFTALAEAIREDIAKSSASANKGFNVLAKSFMSLMDTNEQLSKSVKAQSEKIEEQESVIKSLETRLESLEKQPVGRKAVVEVVEKSFETDKPKAEEQLTKGEILAKLSNAVMNGNKAVTTADVVKYESTGEMREEVRQAILSN
ncbi:hypothetical protein [Bacillus subtilis]|uniref:hypothetical protein n=1 Tax=Bacillus subtilis TaxID=1423 RepID=UPI0025C9A14D|nr:hypothetical protein [Bacillus subtilis]GLI90597.1 hypothetical protein ANABIO4_39490 [Bacillus subtilis]